MKTSEFKKIVEENGCEIYYSTGYLELRMEDGTVSKINKYNDGDYLIYGEACTKLIAQSIIDYAYTPLEERGEEKKYRLRLPSCFDATNPYYLFYHKGFSIEYQIVLKVSGGDNDYAFTQKEIDEMPFDTSFFIKEEV